jgi:hypothetical protein
MGEQLAHERGVVCFEADPPSVFLPFLVANDVGAFRITLRN